MIKISISYPIKIYANNKILYNINILTDWNIQQYFSAINTNTVTWIAVPQNINEIQ